MSDALATQLARALNIPPDAAQHTLNHLVAALHEQLDATGQAAVPGLGTFLREGTGLAFRPDEALARAVNHRYAGLRPIDSAPREADPDDPFAEVDLSTPSEPDSSASPESPAGFQPLDTFVGAAEPEPAESEPEEPEPEEESDYDEADEIAEVDEAPTAPVFDEAPAESFGDEDRTSTEHFEPSYAQDLQDAQPPPEEEQPVGEMLEADESEHDSDSTATEPEDADTAAEESLDSGAVLPAVIEPTDHDDVGPASDYTADEEEEADVEPVSIDDEAHYAQIEPDAEADEPDAKADEPDAKASEPVVEADESVDAAEAEATGESPADEDEDDVGGLDDLNDLVIPATDDETDDEDLDATSIFPSVAAAEEPAIPASPSNVGEPPAGARPVAPAVAATSDTAPDRKPAEPARRRGVPVFGIVVGLATILGIVALLWLLNREPEGPALAERPVPADTTTAVAAPPPVAPDTTTSEPSDTDIAATQPPADSAPPADPLRGGDGIDRADGGFSWVVGSELSREPAERRVAAFRAQGLRADVIAEEAAGRTRYRVALGQFESIEQAERFRSDLPAGVPADTWLLRL